MIGDAPRPRLLAAAALGLALAGLAAWWAVGVDGGEIGQLRVTERPDGAEVVLSLLEVRAIEGPGRYVLGRGQLRVPVHGPTDALRPGEELTVGGVMRGGEVVEAWRAPAPDRPAKKALGLLGLALGAALAGVALRPVPGGLALRG